MTKLTQHASESGLKKDEQQPSQRVEDEAARCRQVLASKSASEAAKLEALNTLNRLRWGS